MARDDTARDLDSEQSLLDRRSYLKLSGAAAASVAAAGAYGGSASAQESSYDTITVSAGQKKTISVSSGETFENVLIDMTADGASAEIRASGDDWTIRNVGFKGNHPGGHYMLTPGVSSEDGHGLVENVYMGDGQTEGTAKGGVWVNANLPHRGTLEFRNVHIAHMIDNGLYGSGPGAQGYGGVTNVYDSYFHSNMIANVRLNSREETSYVKNTTINVDDTVRPCGAGCSAPGSTNTRAVWVWYGKAVVENCDVRGQITGHKGGSVETKNTRTGSDADMNPPEGVPMSAEAAAQGGGHSGSADGSSSSDSSTPADDSASSDGSGSGDSTQTESDSDDGPDSLRELVELINGGSDE
jgi:hypothetical protein